MKEHVWITSRKQRLSAMLHLSATFRPGGSLVVFSHGFTGDKVGNSLLTRNLANYLEDEGYAVLRFDYLGSGDSDGDFAQDTLVSGWRQDLAAVLAWAGRQPQLASSPIILYGHSLGGLIVLTHQDNSQKIIGRIAFAPVTNPLTNFRDIILGSDLWQQSLAGKPIANFYGRGFTLNSQFVRDLLQSDYQPVLSAAQLSTPLLLIHGEADVVVSIAGSRKLYEQYNGPKEFLEVQAMDHVATGKQEELQKAIREWLQKLSIGIAISA